MQRTYKAYLEDIIAAIGKINEYAKGLSFEDLARDSKTLDAVIRNLEIIGEAAKKIPDKVRDKYPAIEWKKICGLRDILIHEYFGIDVVIIWDVIQSKLPVLEAQATAMLKEQKQ